MAKKRSWKRIFEEKCKRLLKGFRFNPPRRTDPATTKSPFLIQIRAFFMSCCQVEVIFVYKNSNINSCVFELKTNFCYHYVIKVLSFFSHDSFQILLCFISFQLKIKCNSINFVREFQFNQYHFDNCRSAGFVAAIFNFSKA